MPKFRVKIEYALWHYEEHEVDIAREDYDSDEEYQEAIAEFHEFPNDYCHAQTRKVKDTGDIMNNTWKETIEEINVLDQIVAAVDGTKVVELTMTTVSPEDLLGLPYREDTDES